MKEMVVCEIPKEHCSVRTEDGYCSLGKGYKCQPVVEKCEGCAKIENGYCSVYIFPETKWRAGNCPMATHIEAEELTPEQKAKKRIGQQKHGKKG